MDVFDNHPEEAKYRVAKRLLSQGHDPYMVARAVGLSLSEVKRLVIQVRRSGS